MKNATILILFLCCTFPVVMQAQTEFSQTGAQWKINRFCYGTLNDTYINNDYLYELGGDTLLEEKSCKKLYQDEKLIGAFLEEERKIWYYPFREYEDIPEKILLYDFSKEKGDKIESYKIPWNIGGDLSYCDFSDEPVTLTVEDVYHEYGRKVMVISSSSYYGREDVWIEGFGSPQGFWGAYEMLATDGVNRSTSLMQVLVPNKTALYYKGQIINPDYQSTFLKEGKTWEVMNHRKNTIDKIIIGKPQILDNYLRYPVSSSVQRGYLYDVNGTIYFMFDRGDGIAEGLFLCDHLLYNFGLSVGNYVRLCTSPYFWGYGGYMPPSYEFYDVTQSETIQYRGKSLKRIVLEGDIKHVWLENIGSLNSFLYIYWGCDHLKDIPQSELLRCYLGDEVFYDCTDFPDGIEEVIASVPTYTIIGGRLTVKNGVGYHLSLYDISGKEIYVRTFSEMIESVPLSDLPATLLIGRLQKGDIVLSFKIGENRK
ncbi:hypothetical protein [Bacteroides sp.]